MITERVAEGETAGRDRWKRRRPTAARAAEAVSETADAVTGDAPARRATTGTCSSKERAEARLSTVRIYKVAELLNTTSQEVMALLKRDHGIEVKSASSTIEEVVARQFVERLARQRGITLPPPAQMFVETAVPPKGGGARRRGARTRAAAQAGRAVVGPPRLVKTITPRPATMPAEGGAALDAKAPAPSGADARPVPPPAPVEYRGASAPEQVRGRRGGARAAAGRRGALRARTRDRSGASGARISRAARHRGVGHHRRRGASSARGRGRGAGTGSGRRHTERRPHHLAVQPAAARPQGPVGRIVPPTLRLRIEDPAAPQTEGRSRVAAPPRQTRPHAQPGASQPIGAGTSRPAGLGSARGRGRRPAWRSGCCSARRDRGHAGPPRIARRSRPHSGAASARPAAGASASQIPGRTMVMGPGGIARPSYQPTGTPIRPSYQPGARPGTPGQPTSLRPPTPATGRPAAASVRVAARVRPARVVIASAPGPSIPQAPAGPPPVTRTITLAEGMTVKDLSDKLEVRVKDVLKKLIDRRMMMTINTTLDTETATMIAREFGADVKMQTFEEEMLQVETDASKPEDLVPRAPVVTVMGHVDHGKTTLLDAIRETRVAEREAGGITQHIGAYAVDVNKRKVVFLDTPGHEAFTMMRARGAKVTDVVILVVAADDGVMPQTKEAIDHARAANVPIIVAINKIDKPDANPERVKQALAEVGLLAEDWGGDTVMVPVSAKKRENLDALLEMVLLVADIGEFKANPKRAASGTVLEAKLDRGRGPVATVLVQDGTLNVGDTVIAGTIVGKVRALIDDRGRSIKTAGPSTPVEVLGLAEPPSPGDTFQALADAAKARQIALFRQTQAKETVARARSRAASRSSRCSSRLPKAASRSCRSSSRPTCRARPKCWPTRCSKLGDERVKIRIIHAGVGAINESDVLLALDLERHRHRLQRPAGSQRRGHRRAREGRRPPALGHLQRDRRDQEGDGRAARADAQGSAARHGGSAADLQDAEVRHHRRLHGHRRRHQALGRCAGPPAARQRAGATRASSARCAASRTTCQRGQVGLRVRHRLRELQRHQGRRRHRGLHGGARRGDDSVVTRWLRLGVRARTSRCSSGCSRSRCSCRTPSR